MRNARVFISCGQRNEREKNIGFAVEDYFDKKGFKTYFAERVHSPDALTENIFKFLRQSEYFVFIDFKREKINETDFRGSLFVNQEIGIATFLGLEGIGFHEDGTKREGILDYHMYKPFPFTDINDIIKVLDKEINNQWDVNSVKELEMIYRPEGITKTAKLSNLMDQPFSDWYHLEIKNRDKKRHAFSCTGYVTKLIDLNNNVNIRIPTNELIWAGIGDINVNIIANTTRDLDAFFIIHNESQIRFNQRPFLTTNPKYSIPNLQRGKYLLEYTIISSNFEKVSKTFFLQFSGSVKDIIFKEENQT